MTGKGVFFLCKSVFHFVRSFNSFDYVTLLYSEIEHIRSQSILQEYTVYDRGYLMSTSDDSKQAMVII